MGLLLQSNPFFLPVQVRHSLAIPRRARQKSRIVWSHLDLGSPAPVGMPIGIRLKHWDYIQVYEKGTSDRPSIPTGAEFLQYQWIFLNLGISWQ